MKVEDRELLVRYVLGEMSAEESAQIDERLLREAEFADYFEELRFDLLDTYTAGELAAETRHRLEAAFGTKGAADVAFAAALAKALSRLGKYRRASVLGKLGWNWKLAVATCSVITAALIGLAITERFHRRDGTRPEQVTSSPPIPGVHDATGVGARSQSQFVVLLNPNVLRGGATAVQKAPVPEDASSIKVQIIVPDPGEHYSIEIVSHSGRKLASFDKLFSRQVGNTSFVQFSVPRASLPVGRYRIRVFQAGGGPRQLSHLYELQILAPH
jgi:hypothetical protein